MTKTKPDPRYSIPAQVPPTPEQTLAADILEIVRSDENGSVLRLCVGGDEVRVQTYWAGDPDGPEGIHREWLAEGVKLSELQREAVTRLLVYTGLMA